MTNKPSFADILYERRKFILAILSVPVLGMAIAFGLIIYKRPNNMMIVLGVIVFVAVQYIMTMFFWLKKVEQLAKRSEVTKIQQENNEHISNEVEIVEHELLKPEEERVLPVKDN